MLLRRDAMLSPSQGQEGEVTPSPPWLFLAVHQLLPWFWDMEEQNLEQQAMSELKTDKFISLVLILLLLRNVRTASVSCSRTTATGPHQRAKKEGLVGWCWLTVKEEGLMALLLPSLDWAMEGKIRLCWGQNTVWLTEMFPFAPLCETSSTKCDCSFSLLTKELKDQWESKRGKGKKAQSSE